MTCISIFFILKSLTQRTKDVICWIICSEFIRILKNTPLREINYPDFFLANLNENHYHKSGLLKRWLQRKGNQTVAWRSLRRWTRKWTKNLKEGGRRGMDFSERNSNKTTEKTLKQVYSFCFQATLKLSACILKSKVIQG